MKDILIDISCTLLMILFCYFVMFVVNVLSPLVGIDRQMTFFETAAILFLVREGERIKQEFKQAFKDSTNA